MPKCDKISHKYVTFWMYLAFYHIKKAKYLQNLIDYYALKLKIVFQKLNLYL